MVGPTTASKGYKEDGYLVGGEGQCCVVGGGVSQFGTTMFNAIFWSGYEIGTFRPHTAWLSRYPLGIGGASCGCGSSREHAPVAMGAAGARVVVAESYARIFFRNCVAT